MSSFLLINHCAIKLQCYLYNSYIVSWHVIFLKDRLFILSCLCYAAPALLSVCMTPVHLYWSVHSCKQQPVSRSVIKKCCAAKLSFRHTELYIKCYRTSQYFQRYQMTCWTLGEMFIEMFTRPLEYLHLMDWFCKAAQCKHLYVVSVEQTDTEYTVSVQHKHYFNRKHDANI